MPCETCFCEGSLPAWNAATTEEDLSMLFVTLQSCVRVVRGREDVVGSEWAVGEGRAEGLRVL